MKNFVKKTAKAIGIFFGGIVSFLALCCIVTLLWGAVQTSRGSVTDSLPQTPVFDEAGWTSQIPEGLFAAYQGEYRDISHLTGAAPRISKNHHESEPV